MNKHSVTFAAKDNSPDRVFLGNYDDFLRVGIVLQTVPGQEWAIMTRQNAHVQAPTVSAPLGGGSHSDHSDHTNGYQMRTPAMSPTTD